LRNVTLLQVRHSFLAAPPLYALVLAAVLVTARGQVPSPDGRIAFRAVVVLTPEFCGATERSQQWGSTFEIGEAACTELEPALKQVFPNLTRVAETASSGDADVILLPRFANIGISIRQPAELFVWVEWTLKDKSGKTVWIGTVQGYGKHRLGGLGRKKDLQAIVTGLAKNTAEQSARAMSSAPELRKLSQ
jgi:hypothetical protein